MAECSICRNSFRSSHRARRETVCRRCRGPRGLYRTRPGRQSCSSDQALHGKSFTRTPCKQTHPFSLSSFGLAFSLVSRGETSVLRNRRTAVMKESSAIHSAKGVGRSAAEQRRGKGGQHQRKSHVDQGYRIASHNNLLPVIGIQVLPWVLRECMDGTTRKHREKKYHQSETNAPLCTENKNGNYLPEQDGTG